MSHATPILDLESGPVPASALPTAARHDEIDLYGDKEKPIGGDEKDYEFNVSSPVATVEGVEPTEEEYQTLRKVPAKMTWVAIAMCFIELAERASYYGCQYVFANFVRGALPPGGNGAGAVAPGAAGADQTAGALGLGSTAATATGQTFTFLAYVIPIIGGIIADTRWGRFKTLCIGTGVGIIAHFILVIPAIPAVIASGKAIGPFIIGILALATTSGFIKPCLGPLLCDQSPVKRPTLITTKKGERVILDPQATVSRYFNIMYLCINVGGFFGLATTYSERFVGFWLAFLEPGVLYLVSPFILWWANKRLYKAPPQGSVVWESVSVFRTLFRRGGFFKMFKGGDSWWNSAKPSTIMAEEGTVDEKRVFWDDHFVDEIRQSFVACGVFFLIPIFLLADQGIGNQVNSMSAGMKLSGLPNDVFNNINPLFIIIATPIITYGLYPFMEKIKMPLKPMTRMCIGFLLGTVAQIFCAVLQYKIYQTSPCGKFATDCKLGPAPISVLWQIPVYGIPAIGEIFVMVTSYEIAYTRAPARMKGLVYALCLFNSAISAAIGLALSDVITDPNLVIPAYVLAALSFVTAFVFPTYFRHLNEPFRDFADTDRMAGKHQPLYKAEHPSAERQEA